jgi:hypothetical protein
MVGRSFPGLSLPVAAGFEAGHRRAGRGRAALGQIEPVVDQSAVAHRDEGVARVHLAQRHDHPDAEPWPAPSPRPAAPTVGSQAAARMLLQSAASATASSAVNRRTTESTCPAYRHPQGDGHRHLAAAVGALRRAAWPGPPGRGGAGSAGLPRSSAASATRSRSVHRSRTITLFLVSKHPDEGHGASATVGLAHYLAHSLHEVLTSGWTGSSNEAGQAHNRPTALSSPVAGSCSEAISAESCS